MEKYQNPKQLKPWFHKRGEQAVGLGGCAMCVAQSQPNNSICSTRKTLIPFCSMQEPPLTWVPLTVKAHGQTSHTMGPPVLLPSAPADVYGPWVPRFTRFGILSCFWRELTFLSWFIEVVVFGSLDSRNFIFLSFFYFTKFSNCFFTWISTKRGKDAKFANKLQVLMAQLVIQAK